MHESIKSSSNKATNWLIDFRFQARHNRKVQTAFRFNDSQCEFVKHPLYTESTTGTRMVILQEEVTITSKDLAIQVLGFPQLIIFIKGTFPMSIEQSLNFFA